MSACWCQNSDDMRQRQNTWCKTQDTIHGPYVCDLFKQFYFDWILFYWLNLTCDWLGNIVMTWETWDTTCGTLMCDSFKWAAWLNFDLLVGELDMELVWQLDGFCRSQLTMLACSDFTWTFLRHFLFPPIFANCARVIWPSTDDGKTVGSSIFFRKEPSTRWTPVPIATRRRYKIQVYRRPDDTHALHMQKFQLHRQNAVRYVMIQNNQPVFELTKKSRWRDVIPREPQPTNHSSIADIRAQDMYWNDYLVDCCVFASYLSPDRPLLTSKFRFVGCVCAWIFPPRLRKLRFEFSRRTCLSPHASMSIEGTCAWRAGFLSLFCTVEGEKSAGQPFLRFPILCRVEKPGDGKTKMKKMSQNPGGITT